MILTVSFGACHKEKDKTVLGYKPVYITENDLNRVETKTSEPLVNPGKIYVYSTYLLVNEKYRGIHIYDNFDKSNPKEISFISILGSLDFSVKENMLYADNLTDMVIVDISNPNKPVYKNRIKNIFPIQQFPDEKGAFECVNPLKGMVIRWEKVILTNPKCSK